MSDFEIPGVNPYYVRLDDISIIERLGVVRVGSPIALITLRNGKKIGISNGSEYQKLMEYFRDNQVSFFKISIHPSMIEEVAYIENGTKVIETRVKEGGDGY